MRPGEERERRHPIPYDPRLALALNRAFPGRYPFLLESAASGTPQGRFDILFAFPGERLILDADFHLSGPSSFGSNDFLSALNGWWQHEHVEQVADDLPFCGGWFLFLAYELAAQVEPTLALEAEAGVPVALAVRIPCALVLDRQRGQAWLVGEPGSEEYLAQIRSALDRLAELGFLHLDARNNKNLLLTPEGRVVFIDLAGSFWIRPGKVGHGLLRRISALYYEANIIKWETLLHPGGDPREGMKKPPRYFNGLNDLRRAWKRLRARKKSSP